MTKLHFPSAVPRTMTEEVAAAVAVVVAKVVADSAEKIEELDVHHTGWLESFEYLGEHQETCVVVAVLEVEVLVAAVAVVAVVELESVAAVVDFEY